MKGNKKGNANLRRQSLQLRLSSSRKESARIDFACRSGGAIVMVDESEGCKKRLTTSWGHGQVWEGPTVLQALGLVALMRIEVSGSLIEAAINPAMDHFWLIAVFVPSLFSCRSPGELA